MEISRAIEILKNKSDYIVPNSDFDEAIAVAISVMEQVTEIDKKVKEKIRREEVEKEIINMINEEK